MYVYTYTCVCINIYEYAHTPLLPHADSLVFTLTRADSPLFWLTRADVRLHWLSPFRLSARASACPPAPVKGSWRRATAATPRSAAWPVRLHTHTHQYKLSRTDRNSIDTLGKGCISKYKKINWTSYTGNTQAWWSAATLHWNFCLYEIISFTYSVLILFLISFCREKCGRQKEWVFWVFFFFCRSYYKPHTCLWNL